jgi:hypothetical protein
MEQGECGPLPPIASVVFDFLQTVGLQKVGGRQYRAPELIPYLMQRPSFAERLPPVSN